MTDRIDTFTKEAFLHGLINGVLLRAKRAFATKADLKDEDFKATIASGDNVVVMRVQHEGVLANGDPWIAIVTLTKVWSCGNQRRLELLDVDEIWRSYDEQVEAMRNLNLFADPKIDSKIVLKNLRSPYNHILKKHHRLIAQLKEQLGGAGDDIEVIYLWAKIDSQASPTSFIDAWHVPPISDSGVGRVLPEWLIEIHESDEAKVAALHNTHKPAEGFRLYLSRAVR